MNQIMLDLDPLHTKARKEVFLDKMNQVVPWPAVVELSQPHVRGVHPSFSVEPMLRIHCLQLWQKQNDSEMYRPRKATNGFMA